MNNDRVAMCLDVAAATAKKLADDVHHNRLWPGELESQIANINKALADAAREARFYG